MIIGKNNSFGKPNFVSNNNSNNINNNSNNINENNRQTPVFNPIHEKPSSFNHSNVMDKDEMKNKAFSMLQERLSNGTISIEEFNRKCHELGKNSK